jgi:sodium-dependent dicarboxylate transporter 2/3/5
MLMGGGFALAKGFVSSGLSEFLGEELEVLESLPVAVLLLVTCSSLTFLTELTSNVAVCLPYCSLLSFGIE